MDQQFSKVMERIGRLYINGADVFFAKLDPDPWAVAHQELEESLLGAYDHYSQTLAVHSFESKTVELLGLYKRMLELQQKGPPPSARISDAFYKGLGQPIEAIFPPDEPEPEPKVEMRPFFVDRPA